MISLLDVNFLVALFHASSVHHEAAHTWFASNASRGWATCPITIAGAIRVLSNPSLGLVSARPTEVARRLKVLCNHRDHVFWSGSCDLLDDSVFRLEFVQGHKQITDIYLLALATMHGGQLVTFDLGIPLRAVRSATEVNLVALQ